MQKVSCLPINTKIIPNTLKPSYEKNAMPKLESTRLTESYRNKSEQSSKEGI